MTGKFTIAIPVLSMHIIHICLTCMYIGEVEEEEESAMASAEEQKESELQVINIFVWQYFAGRENFFHNQVLFVGSKNYFFHNLVSNTGNITIHNWDSILQNRLSGVIILSYKNRMLHKSVYCILATIGFPFNHLFPHHFFLWKPILMQ